MMDDRIHATSHSIVMNMNTALQDAQKFNELLDEFEDDLDKALPQYSIDRVLEGNALPNLAFNLYCFDTKVKIRSILKMVIQSGLHYIFPTLVSPDPLGIVGWRVFDR